MPERYKKTALRRIEDGEKLTFDKEKGIINEKGEVVVEYSVCKDKLQEIINDNEEEEKENKEEGKYEEVKNAGKKHTTPNDKEEEDEEEEFEEEDYDEEEEEEEDEDGVMKEEIIDTFKEKNKIKK